MSLVNPPALGLSEIGPSRDQIAKRQSLLRIISEYPAQLGDFVRNDLRRLIVAYQVGRHLLVFHKLMPRQDYTGVGFVIGVHMPNLPRWRGFVYGAWEVGEW